MEIRWIWVAIAAVCIFSLGYVCNRGKEPIIKPDNSKQVETLLQAINNLKKQIEGLETKKEVITNNYHHKLTVIEKSTDAQLDTIYQLDTMSKHEIAAYIEKATYYEALYKTQTGIDSIKQIAINNQDTVISLLQNQNSMLEKDNAKLERRVLRLRNWFVGVATTLGIIAILK
ncbi:MAG: hypothetical protein EKK63_15845 [Acinetobacter sp.]|uniref:hypothetical protein n=1 Tax=Acinetobacter sp. TaxID=472 RepID=UPI000FA47EB3|nr:hypothetical protein [Acinetobacter sp.]RUP37041.1 MAG: hypothetical protein EKK63_15845 [Acinetobacter sp.]